MNVLTQVMTVGGICDPQVFLVFFRSKNSFLQSVFPLLVLSLVPGNALSPQRCSCCPGVSALLTAQQLAVPAGALGN